MRATAAAESASHPMHMVHAHECISWLTRVPNLDAARYNPSGIAEDDVRTGVATTMI